MTKYSREFFKKKFEADTMKHAYLSAVKWYSTNILSKDEFDDVQVKFIKSIKGKPTITIYLYAVLDGEEDVMKKHCECCREMHHSFFINEDTHCERCSALGFQNRLNLKTQIKKDYYKEMLRKQMEGKR